MTYIKRRTEWLVDGDDKPVSGRPGRVLAKAEKCNADALCIYYRELSGGYRDFEVSRLRHNSQIHHRDENHRPYFRNPDWTVIESYTVKGPAFNLMQKISETPETD